MSGVPVAEYYENETIARMYRARASAKDIGAFEHDTTGSGIGPYGPMDGGVGGSMGSMMADAGATEAGGGGRRRSERPGSMATGDDAQLNDVGAVEAGPEDAAAMPPDARNVTGDGGARATSNSGGCGCRVGARASAAGSRSLGAIGFVALLCRRRRRARRPTRSERY